MDEYLKKEKGIIVEQFDGTFESVKNILDDDNVIGAIYSGLVIFDNEEKVTSVALHLMNLTEIKTEDEVIDIVERFVFGKGDYIIKNGGTINHITLEQIQELYKN